jgi:valyl-tRNA synthetase
MNVPGGAKIALVIVGADEATKARATAQAGALERLARVASVGFAADAPADSAQIVVGAATYALPLAGVIDLDAERGRLKREIAKEQVEIGKIDKKLSNEQFTSKAPPEVIEEQQDRKAEATARLERLAAALARLS